MWSNNGKRTDFCDFVKSGTSWRHPVVLLTKDGFFFCHFRFGSRIVGQKNGEWSNLALSVPDVTLYSATRGVCELSDRAK